MKHLTTREKDIISLKSMGLGDKQVAAELSISYSTVRSHIDRAKFKLGCSSTLQLIVRAKSMLNAG